ncbi:Ribonuclease BN, tRNA processing enzyme [Pelagibacterium halotolerans]|nr:MBL fold metallo-hydrolase [Pelagibacterium halotolerans]QJR20598.1 MBL fold metallo-hydrolase [Pelagibacterium halotolerans]SEA66995.1 Ribonuclease BN, tRNA processing enzyme [Pelagibacterium halotolerans]
MRPRPSSFVTLGTAGGPVQNPERSQPAHLIMNGDKPMLIDCGEGAIGQITRMGLSFREIEQVFITHHHFDHIGSLFALLGLSMMTQRNYPLEIYGPPGTRDIVDGLVAAAAVPNAIGFGVPGQKLPTIESFVVVREIRPGDIVELDGMRVTNCENTHYGSAKGQGEQSPYLSLSYRFDLPDRSVMFTGDTGECAEVEALAKGVDLLVGEMMDLDVTMGNVRRANPNMPEERIAMVQTHLSKHHLTPEQLGELAARAGANHVVAVHFAPGSVTASSRDRYAARIGSTFSGKVSIGEDLAVF